MKRNNFLVFLIVYFLLVVITIFIVLRSSNVIPEDVKSYKAYVVMPGDTLWDIASAATAPGKDPRKTLSDIRQINNISPLIQPGQQILIPVVVK